VSPALTKNLNATSPHVGEPPIRPAPRHLGRIHHAIQNAQRRGGNGFWRVLWPRGVPMPTPGVGGLCSLKRFGGQRAVVIRVVSVGVGEFSR
jgi:hypothetical protein